MQVIKKVEWLKGSLLFFLSSSHRSFLQYNEHSCNTFQKRISMYMGNLLSTMHASIKWKTLDFNQRSSPPPPLLLPPDTSLYYGVWKISSRCGCCRSLLSQKRARLKVQLHFSSLNIMYSVLEFVMPSYFWCVIFQNALVCELLRGLTHQFSIGHSLIRCEVLVPRSCRRENVVGFWNIHTQSRPLYFGFWESMQNQGEGFFPSSVLKAIISENTRKEKYVRFRILTWDRRWF